LFGCKLIELPTFIGTGSDTLYNLMYVYFLSSGMEHIACLSAWEEDKAVGVGAGFFGKQGKVAGAFSQK
jgi:hypothetical protein